MRWLNLELTTLRSEEYLGADPVQRATWLNLLAYCADQENGGVVKDCKSWGGRRWLQLVGVTSDEVLLDCDLCEWKNDSLHVWKYPKAKEIEVRQKREHGKKGGRPPKTKGDKPDGSPDGKPDGSILQKRNWNRKGKGNRKGKEGNNYTEDFDLFWEAYPKKSGKGGAFKAFNSAKLPPINELVAILKKHTEQVQWTKDGGQFIPNPQTWLNQSRWEDEVDYKPGEDYSASMYDGLGLR